MQATAPQFHSDFDDNPPLEVVFSSVDEEVPSRAMSGKAAIASAAHADELAEEMLSPRPSAPALAGKSSAAAKLAEELLACSIDLSKEPKPVETIITIAGKRAFSRDNISGVVARSKFGKSATVCAILGAIIAGDDADEVETFKFKSVENPGQSVLVIDTEQCESDAHASAIRALTRAGLNKSERPGWLYFISASGWSPSKLQAALEPVMDTLAARHGGMFAVLLDGGADFVAAVNDEEQSNSFWCHVTALAKKHHCAIVSVVHSNESKGAQTSTGARGHLGSQLHRKCETTLFLSREGDVTTISSEVMRGAPLLPEDGVCFSWDDSVSRHRLCDSPLAAAAQAKRNEMRELAASVFSDKPSAALKNNEIIALIRDREGCASSTAAARLKAMIAAGAVSHNTLTRLYTLRK